MFWTNKSEPCWKLSNLARREYKAFTVFLVPFTGSICLGLHYILSAAISNRRTRNEANRRRAQTFGGSESDQTSFEKIRSHRKYGLHVLQGERGDSTLAQPWKLCRQGDPIYFEKILFRRRRRQVDLIYFDQILFWRSSMLRTVDRWIRSILIRSFSTIFNTAQTSFNPLSDQVLLLLDPKSN